MGIAVTTQYYSVEYTTLLQNDLHSRQQDAVDHAQLIIPQQELKKERKKRKAFQKCPFTPPPPGTNPPRIAHESMRVVLIGCPTRLDQPIASHAITRSAATPVVSASPIGCPPLADMGAHAMCAGVCRVQISDCPHAV